MPGNSCCCRPFSGFPAETELLALATAVALHGFPMKRDNHLPHLASNT